MVIYCCGSRSCKGQPGVARGEIAKKMLRGHQIWLEESLTGVQRVAGVKSHPGHSRSTEVNGKEHRRTSDQRQSVVHCWGQRSQRGQLGTTRCQFENDN